VILGVVEVEAVVIVLLKRIIEPVGIEAFKEIVLLGDSSNLPNIVHVPVKAV
jgi:hypothetical protein